MQEDLFSPTIRPPQPPGRRPWRPESIVYAAFFGGPTAAATLGVLNGRRLGLPGVRLAAIAAAGVAGFGVRVAVASVSDNAMVRLSGALAGLLVWLLVLLWQRAPFRALTYRGVEPAGLVWPGLAAFVGCGLLEAALIVVLVR